jgi:hypothetical protein
MSVRKFIISIVSIILVVGVAGSVGAGSGFDISTDDDVPVPTRTVSQGGQTLEVTEIAQVEINESVNVTVTAPSDTFTNLYLYNSNQAIVASESGDGTNEYSFKLNESDGFTPGTYAFVAQHNFTRQAVLPLVIQQYDITVSAPETTKIGSEVTVTTETGVEETNNTAEIVLVNDKKTRMAPTTVDSTGQYSGVIDTTGLSGGEYQIYMIIRGDEVVFGQQEILAIGGAKTIQLVDNGNNPDTSTETVPTETIVREETVEQITTQTEASSQNMNSSSERSSPTATAMSETGPQAIAAALCIIAAIGRIRHIWL